MVPAGARCATHASVAAVDLCQRCGRFLCGECVELVGEDAYCADCAARVNVPASKLARAGLIVTGVSWLAFGGFAFGYRAPLFLIGLVLVPGPGALAALTLAALEWRRMKAGLSAAHGRRWVVATFVFATPLLLLSLAMIAFAAFVFFGLIAGERVESP
jgi:hypothetical protein